MIYPGGTRFVDLNGDGTADMITLVQDDPGGWWGDGGIYARAWLNTANGWQDAPQYVPTRKILCKPNGGCTAPEYRYFTAMVRGDSVVFPGGTLFVDLNGDGKMDHITLAYDDPTGWWGDDGWFRTASLNTGGSDLLRTISNGLGASSTITYVPSTQLLNTQLPFPVQVVSSITTNSGNGVISTTNYTYAEGFYHIEERDFRGFHYVKLTGPVGPNGERVIRETWFHQGNDIAIGTNNPNVDVGYMKGRPYRVRLTDAGGQLFSEITTRYAVDDVGPTHFNPLAEVNTLICDGDGDGCDRQTRVILFHDNLGNLTREEQEGDINDPNDNRIMSRNFSPNTTAWIIGLPTNETMTTVAGTIVAATDFYYDGVISCQQTSTNQIPTKGNLTRTVRLLQGGSNPEVRMAYDAYGNLICTRDPNGNITTLSYDNSFIFPKVVTNALAHQTTTQYYGMDGVAMDTGLYGQVKSVTDNANNVTTTTTYDPLGRRTGLTPPAPDAPTTWSYNSVGTVGQQHVLSTTAGLSTWTYFDGFGRTTLEKRTGPDGKNIASQTIYNNTGTVKQTSLPYFDGSETPIWRTFIYDPMGRVTQATNADGSRVLQCYNEGVTVAIDANNHRKREIRDAFGQLVRVDEYQSTFTTCATDVGAPYATTTYQYDVLGSLVKVTDAKGNQTTMRYDTLGRKIAMSDPDMGRCGDLTVLAPVAAYPWYATPCWNYRYDAIGNLLQQRDAKGQNLHFQYDALNRLRQKDHYSLKSLGSGDVVYRYDDATANTYRKGRLWQVSDPSGSTTFTYDKLGRQNRTDKFVGPPTNLGQNTGFETGTTWPSTWVRDQVGGSTATFTWDATTKHSGAKSVSIANPTGGATISHPSIDYTASKTYTATAWIKTQSLSTPAARIEYNFYDINWNWLGYLTHTAVGGTTDWTQVSITAAPGSAPAGTAYLDVVMAMDTSTGTAWFDDVTWSDGSATGTTYTTQTGYDSLGRVSSVSYPDGASVQYAYNGPLFDKAFEGTMTYARYTGYNALGQPAKLTLGNGVTTDYQYKPNNFRLHSIFTTHAATSQCFQSLSYNYDSVANVKDIFDYRNPTTGVCGSVSQTNTQNFGYDDLNRLTAATGPYGAFSYAYDPIGNMTSNSQVGSYTYPASGPTSVRPHAVTQAGPNSYGYDANGNMTTGAGRTITYDIENRPIQVVSGGVTTTFVYDGDGWRVKKTTGGITTVYIGKLYECTGIACSKYIFAGSQRIALKPVGSSEVYYYQPDHLGSSNVVTNQAGAKLQELTYYPYGQTRTNTGTINVNHKYTSQELDSSTGLYFYNARYYDPVLGRFISADTIIPNPLNPQALNRYSYVTNNPLNYNDPYGYLRIRISAHYIIGGHISYDTSNGNFRGGVGVGLGGGGSVGNNNWDIGASNEWYVDAGYDNKQGGYATATYSQGVKGPSGSMNGWGASGTYYFKSGQYQIGGGAGYGGIVGVNVGYSSFGKGSWSLGGSVLQVGATYDYGTKQWNYSYTLDPDALNKSYEDGKSGRQYNGYGAESGNPTFNGIIDWLGTVMAGWEPAEIHDIGYGTPGVNKAAVDFKLFTDMMVGSVSNTFQTNGIFRAAVGVTISPLYYGAVAIGGGQAFREGQQQIP